MDSDALLLPEPFSEKNIDGSPISKVSEGRALFRNPVTTERRVGERRSGTGRRAEDAHAGYEQAEREYSAPAQSGPAYSEPPEPGPAYSAPVRPETAYNEPPQPYPAYDPEKFEAPVDEKPGMIKNPLPMPPVKKKAALDYDMNDAGYDDYDSPVSGSAESGGDPSADAYGDYDLGSYGSSDSGASYDDYGYGDESPSYPEGNASGDDEAGGYYGFEDEGSGPEGMGSEGAGSPDDDGGYGDYDSASDDDPDYGDYESGSDLSSDYY